MIRLGLLKLSLASIVSILLPYASSEELLPSFEIISKDTGACDTNADLCIKVSYFDDSNDVISAKESPRANTVLRGRLESNGKKAVIIRADEDNSEDTIVFNSGKTGSCTRFSVDLLGQGSVSCLNNGPHPDKDDMQRRHGPAPQRNVRTSEEIRISPRSINPNGYKMKVAVYYDDLFKSKFPSTADSRVEAIMAIVDEMYSEKDTLTTEIEVNTIAIVHQSGYNWGNISDWGDAMSPWSSPSSDNDDLSGIAVGSPHDANLYVFLSGQAAQDGLGLATLDALCDTSRYSRVV